jgi:hypothetical protein
MLNPMESETVILRRDENDDELVIPFQDSGQCYEWLAHTVPTKHDASTEWWVREPSSNVFHIHGLGNSQDPPSPTYYRF